MLGKLKSYLVNWLLKGVHLEEIHIGEHSVVISGTGANMGGQKIENLGAPDSDDDVPRRVFSDLTGRWTLAQAHRGADGKIMVFKGAAANPVEEDKPTGATKEFSIPVTYGSDMGVTGNHPGALIDTAAEVAYIEFTVPLDFTAIISALVVGIYIGFDMGANFVMKVDANSEYGALDEAYDNHSAPSGIYSEEPAPTVNDFISWEVAALLGDLAAGDHVGIKITHAAGSAGFFNETNARILKIHFTYS